MTRQPAHPPQVAVIGGGRWSRVIAETLLRLLPHSSSLLLATDRGFGTATDWASQRGLGDRVSVVRDRAEITPGAFVIVANAAHDHAQSAIWALGQRSAVLVEKPLAATAQDVQKVIAAAALAGRPLLASHVFLFAPALVRFAKALRSAGSLQGVRVDWTDPAAEERDGEAKRYDARVAVHLDWLPHVSAMLEVLGLAGLAISDLQVSHGGAGEQIMLRATDVPVIIALRRNGDARVRRIEIDTAAGPFRYDFVSEPGVLSGPGLEEARTEAVRPLESLLQAALAAAAGESADPRLDPTIALRSARLIDAVGEKYAALLAPWTAERLRVSVGADDPELDYRLAEYLQRAGRLSPEELNLKRADFLARYSGPRGARAWQAKQAAGREG